MDRTNDVHVMWGCSSMHSAGAGKGKSIMLKQSVKHVLPGVIPLLLLFVLFTSVCDLSLLSVASYYYLALYFFNHC